MSVNAEAATRIIKAGLVCSHSRPDSTRDRADEYILTQSDDKDMKDKLAEQEAKERAKAFLNNMGKRGADGEPSSSEASPAPSSSEPSKGKRRKRNGAK